MNPVNFQGQEAPRTNPLHQCCEQVTAFGRSVIRSVGQGLLWAGYPIAEGMRLIYRNTYEHIRPLTAIERHANNLAALFQQLPDNLYPLTDISHTREILQCSRQFLRSDYYGTEAFDAIETLHTYLAFQKELTPELSPILDSLYEESRSYLALNQRQVQYRGLMIATQELRKNSINAVLSILSQISDSNERRPELLGIIDNLLGFKWTDRHKLAQLTQNLERLKAITETEGLTLSGQELSAWIPVYLRVVNSLGSRAPSPSTFQKLADFHAWLYEHLLHSQ